VGNRAVIGSAEAANAQGPSETLAD
jgi:hypothetical protein